MGTTEVEVAFLMADLSGYTALTEVHGNFEAARAVRRYVELAMAVLQPSARLLERVGDEVVIATPDTPAAVRTAIALRASVEHEPMFPSVRCGIHVGTVVPHGDHYIGSALNVTARVAGYARAGQILCSEAVATRAAGLDDVAYQPLGAVRFKNLMDPVAVFEVVVAGERREATVIDPVCRMQVTPGGAAARLPFGGRTFYFCSFDCAKAFAERPDDYTGPTR